MKYVGVDAFNLETEVGYSDLDMVKVFEKVVGRKILYRVIERKPVDIAVSYADSTKSKRRLNWTARRGLDDMCFDAWCWQENNPNGYKG